MDTDMDDEYHTARGTKRPADNDLEGDQRFAKRFSRLNLDKSGRAYVPVSPSSPSQQQPLAAYPPQISTNNNDDFMQVDDTKDKIYIYNLDAELAAADASANEEKVVFLPDIEQRLNQIPRSLVRDSGRGIAGLDSTLSNDSAEGRQLILYKQPNSWLAPPEGEKKRRSISESRAKVRQLQAADRQANGVGSFESARNGRPRLSGGPGDGGVDGDDMVE
ncbi:MAG: hypothetical protein M4579_001882 [Chaenotheca gracillima]|nr:MAG: hypothetical protein M4579_001882 [Chaenotheca gracillima]